MMVGCTPFGYLKHENAWMTVALIKPVMHKESPRFVEFSHWCAHYWMEMRIQEEISMSEERGESDYCAYVTPDAYEPNHIYVVIVLGDPVCDQRSVQSYALHEMCHIKLKHLSVKQSLTDGEKHYEVNECMKEYKGR
jgi:hypothetical protein